MRPWTACLAVTLLAADSGYVASVEQWRRDRETELRADDGWLNLTALLWLKPGPNRLDVGLFDLTPGRVSFRALPSASVTLEGRPVTTMELRPDVPGPADLLASGELRFHLIRRGERFGVRIRDLNHPTRRNFPGLSWFPIRETYHVRTRYTAHPQPKTIDIPNVLGDTESRPTPGYVEFTLHGRPCRLEPVRSGDELFFIFKDLTAGRETYPGGRFLYTPLPRDSVVDLDFNKAYSPPCAFTPYATCPLPPPQNRLGVRVEAGEQYRH